MPIRETKYTRTMQFAMSEYERREVSLGALHAAFDEYTARAPDAPAFDDAVTREPCIVDFLVALIDLCERDNAVSPPLETLVRYAREEYTRLNHG